MSRHTHTAYTQHTHSKHLHTATHTLPPHPPLLPSCAARRAMGDWKRGAFATQPQPPPFHPLTHPSPRFLPTAFAFPPPPSPLAAMNFWKFGAPLSPSSTLCPPGGPLGNSSSSSSSSGQCSAFDVLLPQPPVVCHTSARAALGARAPRTKQQPNPTLTLTNPTTLRGRACLRQQRRR